MQNWELCCKCFRGQKVLSEGAHASSITLCILSPSCKCLQAWGVLAFVSVRSDLVRMAFLQSTGFPQRREMYSSAFDGVTGW